MHAPIAFLGRIGVLTVLLACGPSTQDPDPSGSTSGSETGASSDPSTVDDGGDASPQTDTSAATTQVDDGSDSTGGGGLSQTAACAAYLTCAAAATPAELGALLEAYGPDGTCWQSTPEVAAQCDMACMSGLAQLQEAFCDEPACGGGGDSCASDASGGGEPGPPVIVSVSWTNVPGCTMGVGSDVEFVIEVEDPDHDVSELVFSGFAIGCSGMFDSASPTLLCPNAAAYSAEIEVTDPLGNQDALEFSFSPCVDGSAP